MQRTDATPYESLNRVHHLKNIDYIELYVGNAHHSAHFYSTTFGFTPIAFAGPETGLRDRISYMIAQNDVRLLLTSGIDAEHPITQHVHLHGDSVKDIAFAVEDIDLAFDRAIQHGAVELQPPQQVADRERRITKATVGIYGDTVHSLIERRAGETALPYYRPFQNAWPIPVVGLSAIDHIASCVDVGSVERWVAFYRDAFGFEQLHEESVETEYSAMYSKAVQDPSGQIKFVIMEPAPSKRKSQIEDYLDAHHGPGAQHIAVLTDDIVASVRALRTNGILFRSTPGSYYDMLASRVGVIHADHAALRDLHILVDRDRWGYLFQIFAKPSQARPTLFCEIIQREGARGFGSGNIKALFESIEREQALQQAL